ncbi:MAG: asparaginase [Alphaproteobacteria bacterium]|nr:asparaginase [Alphaproteobacteria bacterium]MCD8566776.1 asparaginase [Alphaproteobacteria bacterium]
MKALILNLGGTIGMVASGNGLRPPENDAEFRKAVERITRDYPDVRFDFETLSTKDSTDLTPADWENFSARLLKAQEQYDFILCPHGTDTMAQTAMALSFGFLAQDKKEAFVNTQRVPVVLTGAMHPLTAENSDGAINLHDAIKTGIEAARQNIIDVLIVFHGRIMRGVNARKVSDTEIDAYHNINGHYAGHIDIGGVEFAEHMLPRDPHEKAPDISGAKQLNRFQLPGESYIQTLFLQPGLSGRSIEALARDPSCLGTILNVLGAGNVPDTLTKVLNEAARHYLFPVFAVSPFPGGNANPGAYEAGSRAFEAGVTFLGDQTGTLAYVKAHWLIANGLARTAPEFSTHMQRGWVGETKIKTAQIPPVLLTDNASHENSYESRLKNAEKADISQPYLPPPALS